jgi:hypothetical protein
LVPARQAMKTSLLLGRGGLLAAGAVVFLGGIIFLATDSTPAVLAVLLNDGLFTLMWTLAAAASGSVLLRWGGIKANRLIMFSTAAGLGLGVFSMAGLGLGLAGWLNRVWAILLPLPGLVLWANHFFRHNREWKLDWADVNAWLSEPAGMEWCWLVPVVLLAMAAVGACLMPGVTWRPDDPHPYDVLSYHLQVPREWYEAARIMPLTHNVFSFFPFNVEIQYLLFMWIRGGPWNAMYAAQFLSLAYAMLMVTAIAGSAARARPAVVGAATAAAVPWVVTLACVAYVESAMMLYGTLALIWAMRTFSAEASDGARGRREFLVAGVMAGLACGVKITCVPMLVLAIPAALLLTSGAPRAKTAARCATLAIVGLAVVSPWLIRNWIWIGNPIFPVGMRTLGAGHFLPEQVDRFLIAHSPRPDQGGILARLGVAWRDGFANWEYGFVLFPVAAMAAATRGAKRDRRALFLLLMFAFIFITWIGFTHLLGRFLVLIVPAAGLMLAGIDFDRGRAARWIGAAIVLLAGAISVIEVDSRLAWYCEIGRAGFFGLRDVSLTMPPELSEEKLAGRTVALVGDAEAFLFGLPISRLKYRTVFDLPPTDEQPKDMAELVRDWLGPEADIEGRDWLIILNPAEVRRLSSTYRHVAGLPRDYQGPPDAATFIDGSALFAKK